MSLQVGTQGKSAKLLAAIAAGKVTDTRSAARASGLGARGVACALVRLQEAGLITYKKVHARKLDWASMRVTGKAPEREAGRATTPRRQRASAKRPPPSRRPRRSAVAAPSAPNGGDGAPMLVPLERLKRIQVAADRLRGAASELAGATSELADAVGVTIGEAHALAPLLAPIAHMVERIGGVVPSLPPLPRVSIDPPSASIPRVARARSRRTSAPVTPAPSSDDEEEPEERSLDREVRELADQGIEVHVNGDPNMSPTSARALGQIARAAADKLRGGELDDMTDLRVASSRAGLPERVVEGECFSLQDSRGRVMVYGTPTLGPVLSLHLKEGPSNTRIVWHRRGKPDMVIAPAVAES